MESESDIDDRVASEEDADLGEYDSDEETGSEDANGFLDMEAAESYGEHSDGASSDETEQFFFPQFNRLPPELRARVWEFFDLDLRVKSRVFNFMALTNPFDIWESALLAEQTAPARAMLATHRESRELALKAYPDTLHFRGGAGIVRYHSERDVVLLNCSHAFVSTANPAKLASFLGNTKYLAFYNLRMTEEMVVNMGLNALPNLKAIFHCVEPHIFSIPVIAWCVSDLVRHFYTLQTDYEEGIGRRALESVFCWPDLENNRAFAQDNVLPPAEHIKGIEVWPMVEFGYDWGYIPYRGTLAAVLSGNWSDVISFEDESASDSETEDEYESDGIDDATIDEDDDSGEDEDDLVVQSGSEDEDLSAFEGFSPLQSENAEIHLDDEAGAGNFSSLEPESPSHGGGASELPAADEEPIRWIGRRKRRIVSSDDEGDLDDKSDEDVQIRPRPTKRTRVVVSDTEDEDQGHEAVDSPENRDRNADRGRSPTHSSESTESSEEDESEDEEPAKAKPMSLFEKLRQYRQENPVSPESDADSDAEASIGNEDFDETSDVHFQDDEVDDEDELLESGGGATDMSEEHSEGADDNEDEW